MAVPLFLCLGNMPPTVRDILDIIETIAPAHLAESWDNIGLMIGSPSDQVRSILLGLDPILPLLDEADTLGANLVITHHPIIFHPLKSLCFEQPDGQFIRRAIRKKINVISCHTNLDSVFPGVSDALATRLGLINTEPLVVQENNSMHAGLGRIGNFPEPLPAREFISRLREACHPPWLLEAGERPEKITRAAVCGGSCSELAETAMLSGAQVFVTAEIKHSVARWAEQTGLWIVDAGHFATENPAMAEFAQQLTGGITSRNYNIDVMVTENQNSPLQLI
ncbi:MAG: Nif3-like dinuclear metal center hexameric protein [Desulfobulbaceae bacterium]|nr:Nif3-like dinuclear metal center hexameric protein [Desulfobulbaceae bacterium]